MYHKAIELHDECGLLRGTRFLFSSQWQKHFVSGPVLILILISCCKCAYSAKKAVCEF
jgi:hypothetical protein